MRIEAKGMGAREINDRIRRAEGSCRVQGCLGQRFLGAGMDHISISIDGTPGNALGAYLNGARIIVNGNAQDAVGDTMNAGEIVVFGNAGDAVGYAMRGGRIWIRGSAGYRAGVHMKEYREKVPVMMIGGTAGSFLGEYQAGGRIVVLGLGAQGKKPVGNFPCTGMHGGKVYLRGDVSDVVFPRQVRVRPASPEDMEEIREELAAFCETFGFDAEEILRAPFTVITPDSKNPYRQMYVAN